MGQSISWDDNNKKLVKRGARGWGPALDVPGEASVDTVTHGSSWKYSEILYTLVHTTTPLGSDRVPISADPRLMWKKQRSLRLISVTSIV